MTKFEFSDGYVVYENGISKIDAITDVFMTGGLYRFEVHGLPRCFREFQTEEEAKNERDRFVSWIDNHHATCNQHSKIISEVADWMIQSTGK